MTQLLDMLQLNFFIYFFYLFFLSSSHAHTRARVQLSRLDTSRRRISSAAFRFRCALGYPLQSCQTFPMTNTVWRWVNCTRVRFLSSALYSLQITAARHVHLSLWHSSPRFFFLKQSSHSFHLLPTRLSSHIRLVLLETGRANLEIATFTPLSFILLPSPFCLFSSCPLISLTAQSQRNKMKCHGTASIKLSTFSCQAVHTYKQKNLKGRGWGVLILDFSQFTRDFNVAPFPSQIHIPAPLSHTSIYHV